VGRCSSVGIATELRAGRSGDRIPLETRFSAPVQTCPGAHPASCTMGTESFLGVKSGGGVTLTPHPLLVPLVIKEYSFSSTPPMGCTACTEPQYLYKGEFYLLHEGQYTFMIISRSFLLRMINISDTSCRENQNTHFVFSNFFSENRAV